VKSEFCVNYEPDVAGVTMYVLHSCVLFLIDKSQNLKFLLSCGKECHSNCLTKQAASSDSASDFYSRGSLFAPRPRHRLS
jgi:hypothetical protein